MEATKSEPIFRSSDLNDGLEDVDASLGGDPLPSVDTTEEPDQRMTLVSAPTH